MISRAQKSRTAKNSTIGFQQESKISGQKLAELQWYPAIFPDSPQLLVSTYAAADETHILRLGIPSLKDPKAHSAEVL